MRKNYRKSIKELEEESFRLTLDNRLQQIYGATLKELINEYNKLYALHVKTGLTRSQMYRYNKITELFEKLKIRVNVEITTKLTEVVKLANNGTSNEDFSLFTDEQVAAIVNQDYKNATFSQRIWKNIDALRQEIEHDMIRLTVAGDYPQQLVAILEKRFGTGYYEAERLIRTESARCFNEANLKTFMAEGVSKYAIIVADDERLCEECAEYKGKEYTLETLPELPSHPNCRCTYIPLD